MEKLKIYGALLLALMSVFTLGGYTYGVIQCGKDIESHRWLLTSVFGFMFLMYAVAGLKEK